MVPPVMPAGFILNQRSGLNAPASERCFGVQRTIADALEPVQTLTADASTFTKASVESKSP